jgi:hypothetical protein
MGRGKDDELKRRLVFLEIKLKEKNERHEL